MKRRRMLHLIQVTCLTILFTISARASEWVTVTLPPDAQLSRDTVIQADEVVLTGRLWTEGHSLQINTRVLHLDNPRFNAVTIFSYKDIPEPAPAGQDGQNADENHNATDGTNGVDGRNGRTPAPIVIHAEYLRGDDRLIIGSAGEYGQNGGRPGYRGCHYPGKTCEDHNIIVSAAHALVDPTQNCPHCKPARSAGQDGTGGNGGLGGDAGVVRVYLGDPSNLNRLIASYSPGKSGANGYGEYRLQHCIEHNYCAGHGSDTYARKNSYKETMQAGYDTQKQSLIKSWVDWDLLRRHDLAVTATFQAIGVIPPAREDEERILDFLEMFTFDQNLFDQWVKAHPWLTPDVIKQCISTWSGVRQTLLSYDLSSKERILGTLDKLLLLLNKYYCKVTSEKPKECEKLSPIGEYFNAIKDSYTTLRNESLDQARASCDKAREWAAATQSILGMIPTFLIVPVCHEPDIAAYVTNNPMASIHLFPRFEYIPAEGMNITTQRTTLVPTWVSGGTEALDIPTQGVIPLGIHVENGHYEMVRQEQVITHLVPAEVNTQQRDRALTVVDTMPENIEALHTRIRDLNNFHSDFLE